MIKEGLISTGGGSGDGRWRCRAVATATALAVLTVTAAAQPSSRAERVPARAAVSTRIAGQYIVVLKGALPINPTRLSEREAREEDTRVAASVKARPRYEYDADIKGFAAHLTHHQLRELRHSTKVAYIEKDARVEELDTQTGAPWNLVRIDERSLNLNGIYNYSPTAGEGVHVYVIDTGIEANNVDFGSRASNGYDAIGGLGSGSDCNGHGTHVAGTVAGTKYGVAKRATLVGVRVLNCNGSGTMAGVIAGVNWVTAHHVKDKSVANMSLGGSRTTALDDAVHHMIESGVFASVAAGNDNRNACDYSPARTPAAFTTAASDNNDRKASFSNWGTCVDAWAPGVAVTSDWIGSRTSINTISGTSMAAPAVAGTAALYLAEHGGTPAHTTGWILGNATADVITNGNYAGTPNRLLYTADL
jgi:subtilisin family serine protease